MRAIADEFFAGEGAGRRPRERSSPWAIRNNRSLVSSAQTPRSATTRAIICNRVLKPFPNLGDPIQLDTSFRSTDAVLKTVDAVFEGDTARQGVVEPGDMLQHNVHRTGAPGRVELWPVVQAEEQSELLPWAPPVVRRHQDDPESRLASVIAAKIRYWLDHDALTSKDGTKRPIQAGDVMILVRRRRRIVDRLVRAEGRRRSGGRRRPPGAHTTTLRHGPRRPRELFAAAGRRPDLSDGSKGPLIGFDDDDLFELAFDRGERSLWQILVARAAGSKFDQARLWLGDMLARADFVAPYELFAGILARPTINGESGRKAMISASVRKPNPSTSF